VSASGDRTLKVWDLDEGRLRRTLAGHTNRVSVVTVTSDGRAAVSASYDHTLKVWDLARGILLTSFHGDAPFASFSLVSGDYMGMAGDVSGRLHFLLLRVV